MISLIGLMILASLAVAVASAWECRRYEREARTAMHETWPDSDWINK
jgi:hypothetical protein